MVELTYKKNQRSKIACSKYGFNFESSIFVLDIVYVRNIILFHYYFAITHIF